MDRTSPVICIQGTPPFNATVVGDGTAARFLYGVVPWSSRPQGTACLPTTLLMVRPAQPSSHARLTGRMIRPHDSGRLRLADLQEVVVRTVAEHCVEHTQQPPRHRHERLLAPGSLLDVLIDPPPRR